MSAVLQTVLFNSLAMLLPTALLFALGPCIRRRYRAGALHTAWLTVLIGYLIPYWPSLLPPLALGATETLQAPEPAPAFPIPFDLATGGAGPVYRGQHGQLLLILWGLGALVSLGVRLHRHYRFVRFAKRWARPVENPQVQALFDRQQKDFNLSGKASLLACPSLSGPLVYGLFHPVLLLPDTPIPAQALELVIRHELAHIRRRDLLKKIPTVLAISFHWFNPLVYLAARQQSLYCELSCDDLAVKQADYSARLGYSGALLALCAAPRRAATPFSTNFQGGKKHMKYRLQSILSPGSRRAGTILVAVALLLTLAVGSLTAAARTIQDTVPQSLDEGAYVSAEELYQCLFEGKEPSTGVDVALLHRLGYLLDEDGEPLEAVEEDPGPWMALTFHFGDGTNYAHAVSSTNMRVFYGMNVFDEAHVELYAEHYLSQLFQRAPNHPARDSADHYSYTVAYGSEEEMRELVAMS